MVSLESRRLAHRVLQISRPRSPRAQPVDSAHQRSICLVWLPYGPTQTPHDHHRSSSSAKCEATSSSLHPCPAPTEAPLDHPNPIALPASTTPAAPFKRPYRNCPGKTSAHSSLIERGSPDKVLSFVGIYRCSTDHRPLLNRCWPLPACDRGTAGFTVAGRRS